MMCLLLTLPLCIGLFLLLMHAGPDDTLGRDAAILAGLLAGLLVGMTMGGWLGASRWGWHSGETWYAVLFPALLGSLGGTLVGGVLAAFFARGPGRPRFITGAVACGLALLVSVGLALVFGLGRS